MSKHTQAEQRNDQESHSRRLAPDERETVIVKTMAEDRWTVYSCVPSVARKITRIAKSCGAEIRDLGFGGVEADLPEECILIRGVRRKRKLTDEQRAAAGKRLRAAAGARLRMMSTAPPIWKKSDVIRASDRLAHA
jgi:hypothetical protein